MGGGQTTPGCDIQLQKSALKQWGLNESIMYRFPSQSVQLSINNEARLRARAWGGMKQPTELSVVLTAARWGILLLRCGYSETLQPEREKERWVAPARLSQVSEERSGILELIWN